MNSSTVQHDTIVIGLNVDDLTNADINPSAYIFVDMLHNNNIAVASEDTNDDVNHIHTWRFLATKGHKTRRELEKFAT